MSPEYQDANPFSSPLDDGMAAQAPTNPYGRPDCAPDPVAEVGNLEMTPRRIEDIFSRFSDLWRSLRPVDSGVLVLVGCVIRCDCVAGHCAANHRRRRRQRGGPNRDSADVSCDAGL